MVLSAVQARVLGSLIEKGITTPEQYPLSLNALRNACNQSSSREPVMTLEEDEIRQALHSLNDLGLAAANHDSRVPKFEEQARHRLQLRRDETAIVCLLLLRGPQTPGELRTRSERLHSFDDPTTVIAALERLARRETSPEFPDGPLTVLLPRQPGSREARWATTLMEIPTAQVPSFAAQEMRPAHTSTATSAITALAEEFAALRTEVSELRQRLDRLEGR